MDPKLIEAYGKFGGIAGLAIGTIALLFRNALAARMLPKLSQADAARFFRLLVAAIWTLSVLAMVIAYVTLPTPKVEPGIVLQSTTGSGSPAVANIGGNVTIQQSQAPSAPSTGK